MARIGDKELWWDKKFALPNKVKHNKPNLVIWDRQTKECKIKDFSTPLDQNVSMKETEKVNNYMPLVSVCMYVCNINDIIRIIDKELIAETKRTVPEKNDDKVTEDTNDRDRNESIRADEQVPQEQPTTTKQKTNKRCTARADKNDPKLDEGHHPHDKRVNKEELGRIVDEIRPEWIRNYEKYLNIEIEDRLYLTKKDRRIEDIELLAANKIIDETIEREGKSINLWKINVRDGNNTTCQTWQVAGKESHIQRKENRWMDT